MLPGVCPGIALLTRSVGMALIIRVASGEPMCIESGTVFVIGSADASDSGIPYA